MEEGTLSEIRITAIENGPYKVEGGPAPPLVGPGGEDVEPPRTDRYFLCRCGQSGNKPFCDGTHNDVGFEAEGA